MSDTGYTGYEDIIDQAWEAAFRTTMDLTDTDDEAGELFAAMIVEQGPPTCATMTTAARHRPTLSALLNAALEGSSDLQTGAEELMLALVLALLLLLPVAAAAQGVPPRDAAEQRRQDCRAMVDAEWRSRQMFDFTRTCGQSFHCTVRQMHKYDGCEAIR